MDITPYVESLRRDLVLAAEAGSPEVRAAAERMAATLDPATRLALMEALSHAAAEITSELPAGEVDVRLRGRELEFVVTTVAVAPAPAGAEMTPDDIDPDVTLARVTLRLPETLKARAEELAGRAGHSLNTWLVGAVRRAASESAADVDLDLSSIPLTGDPFGRPRPGGRGGRRMTGWV